MDGQLRAQAAEMGLFGYAIPQEWGGLGLDLVQDAAPMLEQELARFRRRGAPAVAGEQVLPQLDFQQAHLPAECRLGHIQGNGGPGKTAELGNAYRASMVDTVEKNGRAASGKRRRGNAGFRNKDVILP